ncbi:MAG: hypothetical protein RL338_698 [Chloroflexota bacterium]
MATDRPEPHRTAPRGSRARRLVAAALGAVVAFGPAAADLPPPTAASLRSDPTADAALATSVGPASGVPVAAGAALIGAADWHAAGYDGSGLRVGVIDGGFDGLVAALGSFPGGIEARCYESPGLSSSVLAACEGSGTDHGTAVAETLAAVVPGARLYVANPPSYADVRETIAWMTANGVRVINASYSSSAIFEGPGDGTSPYAGSYYRIVDEAVARGALWVNAAGNSGDVGWSGRWTDADGDGWLEFAPGDEGNDLSLSPGTSIRVAIRWSDRWGASADDHDLYLFPDGGTTAVARSTRRQDGRGDPVERLSFTSARGGDFELAVRHRAGSTSNRLQLLVATEGSVDSLEHVVSSGTLPSPADSANPGMVTIGAVDVRAPDELELYSSRGPTADGRFRPDVVAPDCADTSRGAFCGTSQATPFAAGVAALLLQASPTLRPAALAAALRSRVAALASVSHPDGASGYGRISLGTPPGVPPPAPPAIPSVTAAPTGTNGLSLPGEGDGWRALATGSRGVVHALLTDRSGSGGAGAGADPTLGASGAVATVVHRRSLDGGASFAQPVVLSGAAGGGIGGAGESGGPAGHAAIAAAGDLVAAAWLEGDPDGTGPTTLVLRASEDGGTTWGSPLALTAPGERPGRPAVAAGEGRIVVGWTDASSGAVTLAWSGDGGRTLARRAVVGRTTLAAAGGAPGLDALPAVAVSGSAVHVAWSGTASRVLHRASPDDGGAWGPVATLDRLAVGSSRPWLAAAGDGVLVAYTARRVAGGVPTVALRRSTDGGATFAPRLLPVAASPLGARDPVVVASGDVIRLAWGQCTTSSCARLRLWYRQSSTAGRTWGAAAALTPTTRSARATGLATAGRVLVLYALGPTAAGGGETVVLRIR